MSAPSPPDLSRAIQALRSIVVSATPAHLIVAKIATHIDDAERIYFGIKEALGILVEVQRSLHVIAAQREARS